MSDSDATSTSSVTDAEREELIDRVNDQSATIGASVPNEVEIDGTAVDLSAFIVECRKVDAIPPAMERKVASTREALRAERERRVERLKTDPIDPEAAETLAEAVIGVDRALNALSTIRHPSFADEHHADRPDGHERWLAFVDQVR